MASGEASSHRQSGSIDISSVIELTEVDAALWTHPPISTQHTGYAPIQEEREESETDTESLKSKPGGVGQTVQVEPPLWETFLVQLFAFLWLVPIITLLILNIKQHIIGASAWCPDGHCFPAIYAEYSYKDHVKAADLPSHYAKETRNLVGGLQFAAKALEIWFIMIASWLVYLITMRLAARRPGLPIGYLTRPSEFDKIPGIFDALLWKTLGRLSSPGVQSRRPGWRVYLFILSTVLLCVICNLIGPAVAVLVIPTLQWIDTDRHVQERFMTTNAIEPPRAQGFAYQTEADDCTVNDFEEQDFSCANGWRDSLNSWVESYGASQQSDNVVSIQDTVSFTYNATQETVETSEPGRSFELVTWSPSRQILDKLSKDLEDVKTLSSNKYDRNDIGLTTVLDTYKEYNNTVQTFLHRNGPILGTLANVWLGFDNQQHWTTGVGTDRWIRCYEHYNISNVPMCWGECGTPDYAAVSGMYTRCIPIGIGWDADYQSTNFSISSYNNQEESYPEIDVTLRASRKAGFLPEDSSSQKFLDECLPKGGNISTETFDTCDWNLLWDSTNKKDVQHRSTAVNTLEMSWDGMAGYFNSSTESASVITMAIDYVVFQSFANYTLDTSIFTNPLFTVDWLLDVAEDVTLDNSFAVNMDPAWTLAAWTTFTGGSITSFQSIATESRDVFDAMRLDHDQGQSVPEIVWYHRGRLEKVGLMPIIQTLGMIDHNTTNATATDSNDDPQQPLLYRYGRVNVYAFGIASRTSWVGLIVCSIGCVVVLAEIILALSDRRRFRSVTQLLVAALEHSYNGEFHEQIHNSEMNVARVPFRLDGVPHGAGKFKFERSV